jgi:putative Ca2+/H+ antiporter (TMEM165/GDT1 family)
MSVPIPRVPAVRDRTLPDVVCYVVLTILVWGVSAFRRGLWQDDVQALGLAFVRSHRSFWKLFGGDSSPLRRLTILPSALANVTPYPIEALQLMSAATWLAMGLLAGWIVSLLLPNQRLTRFLVICLTLTATSDYQTASMVPLAYNLAASSFLAALGCALLWLRDGKTWTLVASALLLASSLWNMDVGLPAVPFAVFLVVWISAWRPSKKLVVLLAVWAIVLIPVAIVEWSFLHDPNGYAARAIVTMPAGAVMRRAIKLWIENFTPWRWAFARPEWYPRPPAAISTTWMAVASFVAVAVFLLRAKTKENDDAGTRAPALVLLFGLMALVANAAYASIQFSEIHYRTHILSRVWASAAIGIAIGWVLERLPRARSLAWAVAVAFVFFGTWGGMERQDLYLSTWRQHQRELSSILTAAPSVSPGTAIILRSGTVPERYLATEADYLTGLWLRLLYDQPTMRALRLSPDRVSTCNAAAGGLECHPECSANQACPPARYPYDELVMMDYDRGSGTYHLVSSLRGDPIAQGHEADAVRYRPEARIERKPWTLRQRRLLLMQ